MSADYLNIIKNSNADFADAAENPSEIPTYFDVIKNQKKDTEIPKINKIQSYLAAPAKGAIREVSQQLRNLPGMPKGLKESGLVMSDEQSENLLDKLSPQPEDFISKSLERGGKLLPYAAIGGAGAVEQALPRSLAGGAIGQTLEELNAPPWLQAIGEGAPFAIPGFRRAINPTQGQAEQVGFLRRMGLSEEQIAPAIQGERKGRFLSRLVPRRGRTQRALQETRRSLGNVYNQLRGRPEAQQLMNPQQVNTFANEVAAVTQDWPAALRDVVRQDAGDLARSGFTGDNLINFWQDLNYAHNLGHQRVGTLKGPITNALDSISPELGRDFRMTNDIYSNFSTLAGRLRPGLATDLINGAARIFRSGRVLYGFLHGNYPVLLEALGEEGARLLGREMLINPRFQNLARQMVTALNHNRVSVVKSLTKTFSDLLEPIDKKASKEIQGEKFRDLIKSNRPESAKEKRKQNQK